jgi:glycosyltransferase involved in cell wall biosynthesis
MKTSFRIAMVAACPFPYPRGTPIRIFRMAEALAGLGQEIHVITYHLGQNIKSIDFLLHRIPKLKFYRKVSPGPNYIKLMVVDPLLTYTLIKLYRKYNFDIIHAHHFEGLMASWAIKLFTKTPIIYDAHTVLSTELHHYDLHLNSRIKKKLGRTLDRYLPKLADYVICVSEQVQSHLLKDTNMSPQNLSVIMNGIELEHFLKFGSSKDVDEGDDFILGFSGNFADYQGIDTMLRSMSLLKESFPMIKLHIYSNDSIEKYRPLINKLSLSNQIKIFPTNFQSLPDQLSGTDILLNPRSDGSGIPMKLINYMAVGKPTVSFSGSAHVIQHGKTGWIVSGRSPQQFSDGISCLLTNKKLARTIGKNALNHIRQNYSWSSRGKDIIRIYEKLLVKK